MATSACNPAPATRQVSSRKTLRSLGIAWRSGSAACRCACPGWSSPGLFPVRRRRGGPVRWCRRRTPAGGHANSPHPRTPRGPGRPWPATGRDVEGPWHAVSPTRLRKCVRNTRSARSAANRRVSSSCSRADVGGRNPPRYLLRYSPTPDSSSATVSTESGLRIARSGCRPRIAHGFLGRVCAPH